jgi:hypothetical protein
MPQIYGPLALLSFANLVLEQNCNLHCCATCHSKRKLHCVKAATCALGDGESVWTRVAPLGRCCFVSILSKAAGVRASLPAAFPSDAEWLVQLIASQGRFVFGMYRRHMKTIGYLGQIDKLCGVSATTRNWNTIAAVLRIQEGQKNTR